MSTEILPIVIVSGPVGVGKTSVGSEINNILEQRSIAHTFIDFDQLRYTFPKPTEDPWNNVLALQNLKSIWSNCVEAGSLNLIISYVVEEESFITELTKQLSSGAPVIFQLSADIETLYSRLQQRENESGLEWHRNRANELLDILSRQSTPCDYRIETDRKQVAEIAGEIVDLVQWRQ